MVKSSLYTRTGDKGTTSLFGGKRVGKDDQLVEAYGTLDELASFVGWARVVNTETKIESVLTDIQHCLFTMASDVATPRESPLKKTIRPITASDTKELERHIDYFDAQLPPLASFILAAGSELAVRLHLCRTVARRAERQLVKVSRHLSVRPENLVYLNRLSDLFFSLARFANHRAGVSEELWQKKTVASAAEKIVQ